MNDNAHSVKAWPLEAKPFVAWMNDLDLSYNVPAKNRKKVKKGFLLNRLRIQRITDLNVRLEIHITCQSTRTKSSKWAMAIDEN